MAITIFTHTPGPLDTYVPVAAYAAKIFCGNFGVLDGSLVRLTFDFGTLGIKRIAIGIRPDHGGDDEFNWTTLLYEKLYSEDSSAVLGVHEVELPALGIDNNGYLIIYVDHSDNESHESVTSKQLVIDSTSYTEFAGCSFATIPLTAQITYPTFFYSTQTAPYNPIPVNRIIHLTKVEQGIPVRNVTPVSLAQGTIGVFNSSWAGVGTKDKITGRGAILSSVQIAPVLTNFRILLNPISYTAHNTLNHPLKLVLIGPSSTASTYLGDVYIAKGANPGVNTDIIPGSGVQLKFGGQFNTPAFTSPLQEISTDYFLFPFSGEDWLVITGTFYNTLSTASPFTAIKPTAELLLDGKCAMVRNPIGGLPELEATSGSAVYQYSYLNGIISLIQILRSIDRVGAGIIRRNTSIVTCTPKPIILGYTNLGASSVVQPKWTIQHTPDPIILGVQSMGVIEVTQETPIFRYHKVLNADFINKNDIALEQRMHLNTDTTSCVTHTPDPIAEEWIWYASGAVKQRASTQKCIAFNAKTDIDYTPRSTGNGTYLSTDCTYIGTDCVYLNPFTMYLTEVDWDWSSIQDSTWVHTQESLFTNPQPAKKIEFDFFHGPRYPLNIVQNRQGLVSPAYNDIDLPVWYNIRDIDPTVPDMTQRVGIATGIQDVGAHVKQPIVQKAQSFSMYKAFVVTVAGVRTDFAYLNVTDSVHTVIGAVSLKIVDTVDSVWADSSDSVWEDVVLPESTITTSEFRGYLDTYCRFLSHADAPMYVSHNYSWGGSHLQQFQGLARQIYASSWKGALPIFTFAFEGGRWVESSEDWGGREVRVVLNNGVLRSGNGVNKFTIWFSTDKIVEAYLGLSMYGSVIGPYAPIRITFNGGDYAPQAGTFNSDRVFTPFDFDPDIHDLVIHVVTAPVAMVPKANPTYYVPYNYRMYYSDIFPGMGAEVWSTLLVDYEHRFIDAVVSAEDIVGSGAGVQHQQEQSGQCYNRYSTSIHSVQPIQRLTQPSQGELLFINSTDISIVRESELQTINGICTSIWNYPKNTVQSVQVQKCSGIDDWYTNYPRLVSLVRSTSGHSDGAWGLNGGDITITTNSPVVQRVNGVGEVVISGAVQLPLPIVPTGVLRKVYLDTECRTLDTLDCIYLETSGEYFLNAEFLFSDTTDSIWEDTEQSLYKTSLGDIPIYPVEVRVVQNGVEVTPWELIGTVQYFSYTIQDIPEGGWYSLQTRLAGLREQYHSVEVGVGDVIVGAGQSNIDGWVSYEDGSWGTDEQLLTLDTFGRVYNAYTSSWVDVDVTTKSEDPVIAFLNRVISKTGLPTAYVHTPVGGSPLYAVADLFHTGYWLNGHLFDRSIQAINNVGGKCAGILWCQGENDYWYGVSSLQYASGLNQLIVNYREALGVPNLPMIVTPIGRDLEPVGAGPARDQVMYGIHYGTELSIRRDPYVFNAGFNYDLSMRDTIHYDYSGSVDAALRMAQTYLYAIGVESYGEPPKIINFEIVSDTQLQLTLSTDTLHIDSGAAYNGFSLVTKVNFVEIGVDIIDITRVGDVLTIIHESAELTRVRYAYGCDPFDSGVNSPNGVLYTNDEIQYPLNVYNQYVGKSDGTLLMGLNF